MATRRGFICTFISQVVRLRPADGNGVALFSLAQRWQQQTMALAQTRLYITHIYRVDITARRYYPNNRQPLRDCRPYIGWQKVLRAAANSEVDIAGSLACAV